MNLLESLFKPMPNLRKPKQSNRTRLPMNQQSKQTEPDKLESILNEMREDTKAIRAAIPGFQSAADPDDTSYIDITAQIEALESERDELVKSMQRKYIESAEALADPDCPNPDYYRGIIAACTSLAPEAKGGGKLFHINQPGMPF